MVHSPGCSVQIELELYNSQNAVQPMLIKSLLLGSLYGWKGRCRWRSEEGGVCVLHCGSWSLRLVQCMLSSTSCLKQQLAYLVEIISLPVGAFSFITEDKIKTLLNICEWCWRKTRKVFPYANALCIVCVVSANFHRIAEKMKHLFSITAIKQPLRILWQPLSRQCMASWEPRNNIWKYR